MPATARTAEARPATVAKSEPLAFQMTASPSRIVPGGSSAAV
ncbi:hypothetical protein OG422_30305 [Streptomyces sp. NBC_01525]